MKIVKTMTCQFALVCGCVLPFNSVLADTSSGMVIELNVLDNYLVLEDEIAYKLPNDYTIKSIVEGDDIEIVWDSIEGVPIIRKFTIKPKS